MRGLVQLWRDLGGEIGAEDVGLKARVEEALIGISGIIALAVCAIAVIAMARGGAA